MSSKSQKADELVALIRKRLTGLIGEPYSTKSMEAAKRLIENELHKYKNNEIIQNFKIIPQSPNEKLVREILEETSETIDIEYTSVLPLNYIKFSFTVKDPQW